MSDNHNQHHDDQLINDQAQKISAFVQNKNYTEAKNLLDIAIKKWPQVVFFRIGEVECLLKTQYFTEALEKFEKIITAAPDNISIRALAPTVYNCAKDYKRAYYATLNLPEDMRNSKNIVDIISYYLSTYLLDEYNEQIENDVLNLIKNPECNKVVVRNASILLIYKYKLNQQNINLDIYKIADDPLLNTVLTTSHIQFHKIENVIRLSRQSILLSAMKSMEVPDKLTRFVSAICVQNFNNEYIHYVDDEEESALQELFTMLSDLENNADWKIEDIEGLLLLLGMYYKLYDLPIKDALLSFPIEVWPESLAAIAQSTLFGIEEEITWLDEVKSIGVISNETSKKVQSQYEENPYPRWHRISKAKTKFDYYDNLSPTTLKTNESDFSRDNHPKTPHILVAGSGTGFFPLELALNFNCKVTAIDICKRSLAYAMMMQNRYEIDNIEFFQLDILELDKLYATFDAVDCSGVLHHMLDPEQGLQAILNVIKPGGTLKLGFYSELARRDVTVLRNHYLKSSMTANVKNIRDFRYGLLSSSTLMEQYQALVNLVDFYSTSTCRDLLFHEQEHRFTIPQLKSLLEKYNLKFLGFVFYNRTVEPHFIVSYGRNKLYDLNVWQQYELANPDVFINMYNFFVEVPKIKGAGVI